MAGKVSKFSYQKLKQEVIFEEDNHHHQHQNKSRKARLLEVIKRSSPSLSRLRSSSSWVNWLKIKMKFRIKIGGRLRRFFKIRRSNKLKVARLSWANKVYKRLKESQSHFGELFAGNYLFMQVTPGSFNNNNKTSVSSHHLYDHSIYKLPPIISSSYDDNSTSKNYALQKVS